MSNSSGCVGFLLTSRKIQQVAFTLPFVFSGFVINSSVAVAEIIPDNTLTSPSVTIPSNNTIEIIGGTQVHGNLFHSFEKFSVPNDNTAFFNNPLNVTNIISRVTGGSISEINGVIRANGTANLFLINPKGIVFGNNAALDIGGSFLASTAESIKLADGSFFSAVNPQSSPLLTINTPLGLQYGSNPGKITVQGQGNKLFFDPNTYATVRNDRPVGLEVTSGNTLALVGGEVSLEGGNLTATEGRIEVGSVLDSGFVSLNTSDAGLILGYEGVNNFADISLNAAASIDVSGQGGGNVQVVGRNIKLTDGSAILANTEGSITGGTLNIKAAQALQMSGISADLPFSTTISADISPSGTANGGKINIDAKSLIVSDGAQISITTFGLGTGGTINVKSQDIQLIFGGPDGPSGLFANTDGGMGNGGSIFVETDKLLVTDGARIASSSFVSGNGGNVNVIAKDVQMIGAAFGEFPSSLSAFSSGNGSGGNIKVITENLKIQDGAQIATTTLANGDAGSLTIQANNIDLSGFATGGSSGLLSNTLIGNGNGGKITIATDQLTIRNGATITSSNFPTRDTSILPGQGSAGSIQIDARLLQLFDNAASDIPSSINTSTLNGGGGNIQLNIRDSIVASNSSQIIAEIRENANTIVNTNLLALNSGATLSTNSTDLGNAGEGGTIRVNTNLLELNSGATLSVNSTSSGDAGNIFINANQIRTNQGLITAKATQAGGGNINLDTNLLFANNNSLISSSVTDSTGGGGNISFKDGFIVSKNNSDIRANAVFGIGGNISIQTQGIFLDQDSDIDASSKFGIDGQVEITNPNGVEKIAVVALPANVADTNKLVAASCSSNQSNEFVVTGKGGLPENPTETLRGQSAWIDLREMSTSSNKQDRVGVVKQEMLPQTSQNAPSQIIEAQGWIFNSDGRIELVAHAPNITPAAPISSTAKCSSS